MKASWLLVAVGAALAALASAGCLSVPDEDEPQCRRASDCDQAVGEVCEEGVCWGDPPSVPLAAIVGPPGDAKDLVPAELPELFIPEHGWMGDLVLGTPVTLRGRVLRECILPCPETPVEATISVTRPSSFPGGPGLSLVEKTASDGSYVLHLPLTRTRPEDPPYTVVVSPADRGAVRSSMLTAAAAAEELPPLMRSVIASRDAQLNFLLPSTNLPTIDGRVVDGAGDGLAGYRVVARGRWAQGASEAEVSTVAVTAADGSYHLILSESLVGKVSVRAEPPATSIGAATMEMSNLDATGAVTGVLLRLPANQRPAVSLTLPVEATDSGGAPLSGDGFAVRLLYELVSGNQTTRYKVEGSIKSGTVTLTVVPGVTGEDWIYRLRMLPPVDSRLTAVFDRPLVIGAGGMKPPLRLAERVRVTGVVVNERGVAVKGMTLTARPSLSFLLDLDEPRRALVDELGATTATTSKNGEFVVWADQLIAGLPARYSFTFQPPADELSPTWTHTQEISMPPVEGVPTLEVGVLSAPEASNVHGRISNPGGRPVAKGRVLIYRLDSACMETQQGSCASTATLLGRGVADDEGVVRISLPKGQ
jgi:hypothetical protein